MNAYYLTLIIYYSILALGTSLLILAVIVLGWMEWKHRHDNEAFYRHRADLRKTRKSIRQYRKGLEKL